MLVIRLCILNLLLVTLGACSGGFDVSGTLTAASTPDTNNPGSVANPGAPQVPMAWPAFAWDGKHQESATWNKLTYEAIQEYGPSLLTSSPADIESFCPNYDVLHPDDKIFFWISLIASMSRYESGFDPETSYQENFKDQQGQFIVSRGLMQLSIESALGYECPLSNALQLHDAKTNLSCSVIILDRWLGRDGVISQNANGKWLGGARYWSVLRTVTTKAKIVALTSQSEVCQ